MPSNSGTAFHDVPAAKTQTSATKIVAATIQPYGLSRGRPVGIPLVSTRWSVGSRGFAALRLPSHTEDCTSSWADCRSVALSGFGARRGRMPARALPSHVVGPPGRLRRRPSAMAHERTAQSAASSDRASLSCKRLESRTDTASAGIHLGAANRSAGTCCRCAFTRTKTSRRYVGQRSFRSASVRRESSVRSLPCCCINFRKVAAGLSLIRYRSCAYPDIVSWAAGRASARVRIGFPPRSSRTGS